MRRFASSRQRLSIPADKAGKASWVLEAVREGWSSARVLDNGAGGGAYATYWEQAGARLVCLDIRPSSSAETSFCRGSSLRLPFRENSFDIVLFLDVLEHLPPGSEIEALTEIRRVVAPSGNVVLTTPNNSLRAVLTDPAWPLGHRHYSAEDVGRMLEAAGLTVNKLQVRGGWGSVIHTWFLYAFKWILGRPVPIAIRRPINMKVDHEWHTPGFHSVVALASKTVKSF